MLIEHCSDVTITDLPPPRVASFRAISRSPEDDALRVLTRWAVGVGFTELPRSFGFDVEVSRRQGEAGLRGYEVWLVVPEGVQPEEPITIRDFTFGHYAKLTITCPFDDPFPVIPFGRKRLPAPSSTARRRSFQLRIPPFFFLSSHALSR